MGATKARWFVDDLEAEPTVQELGTPVDLRSEPDLFQRLTELVALEGELFNRGVTCAIRDERDSVCSACPVSQVDSTGGVSDLCRVGTERDRVLSMMVVKRCQGRP